ncbi:unnamed protein product, partial [Ectocarpus sp. 12 AP-2014]
LLPVVEQRAHLGPPLSVDLRHDQPPPKLLLEPGQVERGLSGGGCRRHRWGPAPGRGLRAVPRVVVRRSALRSRPRAYGGACGASRPNLSHPHRTLRRRSHRFDART